MSTPNTLSLPKGHTALLIMDCQNDIVHPQGKFGGDLTGGSMPQRIQDQHLLETIQKVAVAARAAHIPVIHVRHAYRPDYADLPKNAKLYASMQQLGALKDGDWGADIHGTLTPDPTDIVLVKTRVSSFYASPLVGILEAQGLTHLILTGVATDGVVEGTARDGLDRGYSIIIPRDCCVGTTQEAHDIIVDGILTAFASMCQADDVIQALA